jgi:4'-phosphopantetheinyl transferase EntD
MLPEYHGLRSKQRANRKRRIERGLGRRAAVLAIRSLLQDDNLSYILRSDMDGCPIWPEGLVGSISHSNLTAVAVVSRDTNLRSLGVDIERIRLRNAKLANHVMRLEEFYTLPLEVPMHVAATVFFSIRESVYKCIFPILHLQLDWKECSVLVDWKNDTFSAEVNQQTTLSHHQSIVYGQIRRDDSMVASVCWWPRLDCHS